jgi:2-aminobenzoylacetyl-CoA thioesterase
MKRPAEGQIHERITAIAIVDYPAYIVRGDHKTLMIDSGINHLGPLYLALIKEVLGDAGRPDYLFFTHSHYDHIGSGDYLKRHLPGLLLGAHERVAGLARKPSALDLMNRLSASHDELLAYNPAGEDVTLRPFDIDIVLKQGDVVDLGGLTCVVYETPGHTRDSLSFYFPEIGALFAGDACGVLRIGEGDPLQVEFVASYADYVHSLEFMITLEPTMVCLAHNWVLTGTDATDFLQLSLAQTYSYREMIEEYLDAAGGDVEKTIRAMAEAGYAGNGLALDPTPAQMTNLSAQIRHIAERRKSYN